MVDNLTDTTNVTYTQVLDPMTKEVNPDVIMAQVEGDPRTAFIPNDDGNKDWRAYQAWLDEGNEPNPPDVPNPPETQGK